jgi:hypothetical protein
MDIPTNSRTQSFAQELFQRTPRTQSSRAFSKSVTAGAGGTSSTTVMSASEIKKKRKEESANLRLLEMNDSYGLIMDEEDNEESRKKAKKSKKNSKDKDKEKEKEKDSSESSRKRDKKIRRKEGGDDWESDEEEKEYRRRRLEELDRESRPTKTEGNESDHLDLSLRFLVFRLNLTRSIFFSIVSNDFHFLPII